MTGGKASPAHLSTMMTPPPLEPVLTMDFLTGEYLLRKQPILFGDMIATDLLIGPDGIEYDEEDINEFPPRKSFPKATQALIDEFQALLATGFTVMLEFDMLHSGGAGVDFPVMYIVDDDFEAALTNYNYLALETAQSADDVSWAFAYADTRDGTSRTFGETTQHDRGRRIRLASTMGISTGDGNFGYGVSWNGTLQDDNIGGNGAPTRRVWAEGLETWMPNPIQHIYFFAIAGLDPNTTFQWGPERLRWRKFELWPAWPTSQLHQLTLLEEFTPLRLSQIYAEIIHA